jgi:plasmid stabilization system protein ParE
VAVTQVIWTKKAIQNIDESSEFVAQKSIKAALNLVDKLLNIERIFLGSLFIDGPILFNNSKQKKYRYFIESDHKIVYYRKKNIVYIVMVFATKQNPKKLKP